MAGAAIPNMLPAWSPQIRLKQPSTKPTVRLPQSPRKIVAGLKLYRRKANSAPAKGAVIIGKPEVVVDQESEATL